MVTKTRSAAPYAFAGILVGALTPIAFAISAFIDGFWEFDLNMLSDLGISHSALAANIFNYTCMIAGLFVVIHSIGKIKAYEGAACGGAVVLFFCGILLAAIGLFTKDTAYHIPIACTYFFLILITVIISAITDYRSGKVVSAAATGALVVIVFASMPGFQLGGIEVIAVLAMCIWMITQSLSLAFSKG